jgi:hypothetical protein
MAGTAQRRASLAAVSLAIPLALGCRSIVALDAATRIGDRPAAHQELVLARACTLLPGGTPMGRPDGVRFHVLPAGRYRPQLEDDAGVYFASPAGISVTEPAPRGTRTLPGGVYVTYEHARVWEYLGDTAGVSSRQPLPEHCAVRIEPRTDAR